MSKQMKDELAVSMYEKGLRVEIIAELLQMASPAVRDAILNSGGLPSPESPEPNRYATQLAGVLRFKDVDAAKASIRRLSGIYEEFERLADRRGMHLCMVLALTGFNRALGIGKFIEASLFSVWLQKTLNTHYMDTLAASENPTP